MAPSSIRFTILRALWCGVTKREKVKKACDALEDQEFEATQIVTPLGKEKNNALPLWTQSGDEYTAQSLIHSSLPASPSHSQLPPASPHSQVHADERRARFQEAARRARRGASRGGRQGDRDGRGL